MSFSKVASGIVAASLTTAVVMLGMGCDGDSDSPTPGGSSSSSSGSAGPACQSKAPVCTAVASDCIALEDNSKAAKPAFRMAQLTITKPAILAAGTIAGVVSGGVEMNLAECNLVGKGTFSWLLELDPATKMMKTGGARPAADPSAGYCFVNQMLDTSLVAPITFDSGLNAGKFGAATPIDLVTVPIFLDAAASSWVLMPLHKVVLDGQISSDNNCIGSYNADKLDPANNCAAEPPDVLQFVNGGNLKGFITLEDADKVEVDLVGQSLCVLLSGNAAMYGDGAKPIAHCKRDPTSAIVYKGSWCSTTDSAAVPGTCEDAEQLEAKFAASSVKVTGDCP